MAGLQEVIYHFSVKFYLLLVLYCIILSIIAFF